MSAPNYEAIGVDAAEHCLNAMLNRKNQGDACTALLSLLESISGCGEIANGARRGASVILVNVLERGLDAIKADRGKKTIGSSDGNSKEAGERAANDCLATVLTSDDQNECCIAIVNFLCDIAGDCDTKNAKRHGAAEILAPIIERGIFSLFLGVPESGAA